MKYKCLILDHDDTVVKSTEAIHYPSFIEYLKIRRPEFSRSYTLDDYIKKNFDIGLMGIFRDELSMTDEEISEEGRFWDEYMRTRVPEVYEGIRELLWKFRDEGGIIAVSSHSTRKYIIRDYKENNLPAPDAIYSWDMEKEKRKPEPFAPLDICERYSLAKDEVLVVDDSKAGLAMARAAGVSFAAACWGYSYPKSAAFMREKSDFYLLQTRELFDILFNN